MRLSIDQIFGPLALGTAARMHPVVIIFCFVAGALMFGVVGLVMAVPVALIVKITLATLYDEEAQPAQPHRAQGTFGPERTGSLQESHNYKLQVIQPKVIQPKCERSRPEWNCV